MFNNKKIQNTLYFFYRIYSYIVSIKYFSITSYTYQVFILTDKTKCCLVLAIMKLLNFQLLIFRFKILKTKSLLVINFYLIILSQLFYLYFLYYRLFTVRKYTKISKLKKRISKYYERVSYN